MSQQTFSLKFMNCKINQKKKKNIEKQTVSQKASCPKMFQFNQFLELNFEFLF